MTIDGSITVNVMHTINENTYR